MNDKNNAVNNSALMQSGFIDIGEEQYPYGKGPGKRLLGALPKSFKLEKLCQDIIKTQEYIFSKEKVAVKPQSPILQIYGHGKFLLVFFSLRNIAYRSLSCYKMSDDKKVLYEYNTDTQSIVSATYYDDGNEVYFTDNRNIIDSLLLKHKVKFGDDVLIDDKNNMSVDPKSNNITNENKSADDNKNQEVKSNSNRNTENINEDSINNSSVSDENKVNNKNGNNANKNQQNSNIIENKIENANKEKLLKVRNELNKIFSKDNNYEIIINNSKKNEPQLEGYEPKTNNGCSCNLDCSGCFKRIFGG